MSTSMGDLRDCGRARIDGVDESLQIGGCERLAIALQTRKRKTVFARKFLLTSDLVNVQLVADAYVFEAPFEREQHGLSHTGV